MQTIIKDDENVLTLSEITMTIGERILFYFSWHMFRDAENIINWQSTGQVFTAMINAKNVRNNSKYKKDCNRSAEYC